MIIAPYIKCGLHLLTIIVPVIARAARPVAIPSVFRVFPLYSGDSYASPFATRCTGKVRTVEDAGPYINYSAVFLATVRLKMVTDMGAIWKLAEYWYSRKETFSAFVSPGRLPVPPYFKSSEQNTGV